jgi:hypothetical protein
MPKPKTQINNRLKAYANILIDNKKRFENNEKNIKEFLSREETLFMAIEKFDIKPISKSTLAEDFIILYDKYKSNLEMKKKVRNTLCYAVINPHIPFADTTITPKKKSEINKSLSALATIDNPFLKEQVQLLSLKFQDEYEENEEGGYPFIQFDKSPIADGSHWIQSFYEGIREKSAAKIEYMDFNGKRHRVEFLPFQLREFNQRWYIIGYSPTLAEKFGEKMFNLALDRIVDVSPLNNYKPIHFQEKRNLFESYTNTLRFAIGLTIRDEDRMPMKLKISVSDSFRGYILTKKIMDNQLEIEPGVFVMNVIKNKELLAKLLSFQDEIEILEPLEFREEFAEMLRNMFCKYEG